MKNIKENIKEIDRKSRGFMGEFRKFIARGNVMDMAVGVIIGAAFKSIVDSLVNDILMPFVGIFIGQDTFASLIFTVGGAQIAFGNFIQSIVNFLIMAFVIFCIVKAMNAFRRKKEEAPAAPPAPSAEEVLLTEIRDLLREQRDNGSDK